MAAGGPVDPTMPLPEGERRGAPQPEMSEPTGSGALPGSYDPTVAVPPVGPPDEPGDPYGPGPGDGDDEPDNRKWLWGILAALGVILLGVIIALLVSGGGDDGKKSASSTSSSSVSSSTSTSTSSSTSTTSTTPGTTAPGAPVITAFTATPSPFPCTPPNGGQITLTWSTNNSNGVNVSIDGPGVFGSYGAQGQQQVPFASCNNPHTYTLTAKGNGGQQVQQTITVQPQPTVTTTSPPPPTTTTSKP